MNFKTSFIIKSALLFLPLILILWWFLFLDVGPSGSIGGGGYTLNGLYCSIFLAVYLVFYEFILLIYLWIEKRNNQDTKESGQFLLAGFLILILVIVLSILLIK